MWAVQLAMIRTHCDAELSSVVTCVRLPLCDLHVKWVPLKSIVHEHFLSSWC